MSDKKKKITHLINKFENNKEPVITNGKREESEVRNLVGFFENRIKNAMSTNRKSIKKQNQPSN